MLFEARGLAKSYRRGTVQALKEASFTLEEGKTLGIIGASGSGKSTLLRLLLRLEKADAGEILFEGARIDQAGEKALKIFRRQAQIIFQDPYLSLDPRMTVARILAEPYEIAGEGDRKRIREKSIELLGSAGLTDAFLTRYPHEISGGECQRVAIARALSLRPKLLLCDEAVSSLDAVTKIQILNLFLRLQKERGISLLFVSHDQKAVRHMSDEVRVMRDGRLSLPNSLK